MRNILLYNSQEFSVYPEKVVQQNFEAVALSPKEISSNYNSAGPPHHTRTWRLQEDISSFPSFHSDHVLTEALYNLSLEEMVLNIRHDDTFMAGEQWKGVWTRDISYSILLSLAILHPEIAKKSLMAKVSRERIIQDTGTGGSWPVSSDRVVWSLAAWEIYLVTGEAEWLKKAYGIIKNSVRDDVRTIFSSEKGMFFGESSFLDWREQSYPQWMSPVDIFTSLNLGTNAVHFRTYQILAQMGAILGEPVEEFRQISSGIKQHINQHLWVKEKGYYAQFLYGRNIHSLLPRAEALGESLAILFDIADDHKKHSILQNSPVLPFGVPCFYPQIPKVPSYHNNGIWPFVQAFYTWSAAKAGNEAATAYGLAGMFRHAALFLSNKENMVGDTGDFAGTSTNSNRQLWSVAGNLAMVYRVFFGMEFTPEGIYLNPNVPRTFSGAKKLENFMYRKANLTIVLDGFGSRVKSVLLDGKAIDKAFINASIEGKHVVSILMDENDSLASEITLADNHFSPETPVIQRDGDKIYWNEVDHAQTYHLYKNGSEIPYNAGNYVEIDPDSYYTSYQVRATDSRGYSSFLSEPLTIYAEKYVLLFKPGEEINRMEASNQSAGSPGYTEISKAQNTKLSFPISIEERGSFYVDFRFANGNGPINTGNKCATRSLYLADGTFTGIVVFPQMGETEVPVFHYSNAFKVDLLEGEQFLMLIFEDINENMNFDINSAMIDHVRLIKIN